MQPRYTADSTVLAFQVAWFTIVPCVIFVAAGAALGGGWGWLPGVEWTLLMWALIWRVLAVRRYEVLDDCIRFVGVLGSTTLPMGEIRRVEGIEQGMRHLLPIALWRRAVQITWRRPLFSCTPSMVFVRDTEAFVNALDAARSPAMVSYCPSIRRPRS